MSPAGSVLILFGDPPKIAPYLDALRARELAVLLIAPPPSSTLERAGAARLGRAGHLLGGIKEYRLIDAKDLGAILAQVRAWTQAYQIKGVFCATEVFVEPAAVVTDLLGLPGVSLRASMVCRNKLLQRLHLGRWSPRYALSTGVFDSSAFRFPVVVKPLALYSSKGVRAFADPDSLGRHLAALPLGTEVMVEERVAGREFNVDTVVVRDAPVQTLITQKGTNEDETPFFAELIHTHPAANLTPAEARQITDVQEAVVRHLGFGTGMAHAEYRLTPDGEVVLMEIAARPPGDGCLALYHLTTGRPIEAALLDVALGGDFAYPPATRRARQVYFDHTPGPLTRVTVDWPGRAAPDWLVERGVWPLPAPGSPDDPLTLRELFVLKAPGEQLLPITESSARAVTAIFDAPLDSDIDEAEKDVRASVAIA